MKHTSRRILLVILLMAALLVIASGNVLAQDGGDGDPDPASVDCHWYYDMGDLPDGYGTLRASDGPRHGSLDNQNPAVRLGALWDVDSDGAPSPDADGDDTDGPGASDEDGVARIDYASWSVGDPCDLEVVVAGVVGQSYLFAGWLDWNGSGGFDAGETVGPVALAPGTHTVQMVCPSTFDTKIPLYARFRLYTAAPSSYLPTGEVEGGEVEDYKWTFGNTAVTLTSLSGQVNWLQLIGAAAIAGALVAGRVGRHD